VELEEEEDKEGGSASSKRTKEGEIAGQPRKESMAN
jgi:hypothetical protein